MSDFAEWDRQLDIDLWISQDTLGRSNEQRASEWSENSESGNQPYCATDGRYRGGMPERDTITSTDPGDPGCSGRTPTYATDRRMLRYVPEAQLDV